MESKSPHITRRRGRIFIRIGGFALVLFLGASLLGTFNLNSAYKSRILQVLEKTALQDITYILLNGYSSLKKTTDIAHFPYWFADSKLETFSIEIAPESFEIMNNNLPENKFTDPLMSENRVFVPAVFRSKDYTAKVEVRYRGFGGVHWNNGKRSLLVKFPRGNLFRDNMKSMDLIIPQRRNYILEIASVERARRAGVKARAVSLVAVRINGKDSGVYLAQERFSQEWLEVNGLPKDSEVFEMSRGAQNIWENWRRGVQEGKNDMGAIDSLATVMQVENDEEFKRNIGVIVDLDKWYRAVAIAVITGSSHSFHAGNLNLLWNSATGRLEPILEDMSIGNWEDSLGDIRKVYEIFDLITKRIMSIPEFYREYRAVLKDLAREENFEKDIAFYDSLYEEFRVEFYKDRAKHHSDNFFDDKIKVNRSLIQRSYEVARKISGLDTPPIFAGFLDRSVDRADIPGHILEAGYSVDEFLDHNHSFIYRKNTLYLLQGTYAFDKNVIIPKGMRLIIEQGTTLNFGQGISLISYSPIEARGNLRNPIKFTKKDSRGNWGSIAIINTKEDSIFENTVFIGGSSSREINGVVFTGMLSAHNAPLRVRNSEFHKDSDDDMINVKYAKAEIANSKFFDSFGDAIDLDASVGFVVNGNKFFNIGDDVIGGDAIDVSFSSGMIDNNMVLACEDKGVSVGEKSTVDISDNKFSRCDMGVAVKDLSYAKISNNEFAKNNTAISLYKKKEIFGGGEAQILGNNFLANKKNIEKDFYSNYYE